MCATLLPCGAPSCPYVLCCCRAVLQSKNKTNELQRVSFGFQKTDSKTHASIMHIGVSAKRPDVLDVSARSRNYNLDLDGLLGTSSKCSIIIKITMETTQTGFLRQEKGWVGRWGCNLCIAAARRSKPKKHRSVIPSLGILMSLQQQRPEVARMSTTRQWKLRLNYGHNQMLWSPNIRRLAPSIAPRIVRMLIVVRMCSVVR